MATTRPTDLPTWAESGTVVEPPASKQTQGWLFQDPPPYQYVNWFWRQVCRWAAHFADATSRFPEPEDATGAAATAPLSAGGSCVIEGDEDKVVGGRYGQTVAPGAAVSPIAIAASGVSLAVVRVTVAPNTHVRETYERDGSGLIQSYGVASTANCPRILNDGIHVAFVLGTTLYVYEHDTGTLVWSQAVAGATTVFDLAWSHNKIFVVNDAVGAELHAYDRAVGGVAVWTAAHNGQLETVAYAPVNHIQATLNRPGLVFVAGALAGGVTLRAFDATTGVSRWTATQGGTLCNGPAQMAADQNGLYIIEGTNLVRRNLFRDQIDKTVASVAAQLWMDLDPELVHTVYTPGVAIAWTRDLVEVRRYIQSGSNTIATDGHAVFTDNQVSFGVDRFYRGTKTALWRKYDPSSDISPPMRQVIAPLY